MQQCILLRSRECCFYEYGHRVAFKNCECNCFVVGLCEYCVVRRTPVRSLPDRVIVCYCVVYSFIHSFYFFCWKFCFLIFFKLIFIYECSLFNFYFPLTLTLYLSTILRLLLTVLSNQSLAKLFVVEWILEILKLKIFFECSIEKCFFSRVTSR